MAPKVPEKQQQQNNQREQTKPLQNLNNNSIVVKHSNPFHISAYTLCHNKRLKQKRFKYAEYLRKANQRNSYRLLQDQPQYNKRNNHNHKTELRRRKLSQLQADVTIDLLSDNEEEAKIKCTETVNGNKSSPVIAQPERMCLERAALLGLMPVDRTKNAKPLPLIPEPQPLLVPLVKTNPQQQITTKNLTNIPPMQFYIDQQQQQQQQPLLMLPIQQLPITQTQPRKRKSKPQKRRSLPASTNKPPILLNKETIVLSDDSNDYIPQTVLLNNNHFYQETPPQASPEITVTCPTSSQIPCQPQQQKHEQHQYQTTMQVDEEVTISLVPRSLTAPNCASRSSSTSSTNLQNNSASASTSLSSLAPSQDVFPMLPDETTVHTVIANRIYELSLTKLREGLASCGIPEFADGQQRISPQRRKGMLQQQPPLVSPPQAPISLKLSSDLSISLISDDDEDEVARQRNRHHEPILSPAFLQKLPVNVSIAPVPMGPPPPTSNHMSETRKLKLS